MARGQAAALAEGGIRLGILSLLEGARAGGAPEYGADTIDVLQRYGYSDADIAALQTDRVV